MSQIENTPDPAAVDLSSLFPSTLEEFIESRLRERGLTGSVEFFIEMIKAAFRYYGWRPPAPEAAQPAFDPDITTKNFAAMSPEHQELWCRKYEQWVAAGSPAPEAGRDPAPSPDALRQVREALQALRHRLALTAGKNGYSAAVRVALDKGAAALALLPEATP